MYRINDLSIEEQIELIKEAPLNFRLIKNPSIEVQLIAIKNNGTYKPFIRYIKDPCLEVQLASVTHMGSIIRHIVNPCEEVQLAAVRDSASAIEYIDNPTEKVQIEAVKKDSEAIQYIKNPCLEAQIEAFKRCKNFVALPTFDLDLILEKLDVLPKSLFKTLYENHYPFKEELKETAKYKKALVNYGV